LEELEFDRLILAEHVPGRDAEQQRVADLPCRTCDGDLHWLIHLYSSFPRPAQSFSRRQAHDRWSRARSSGPVGPALAQRSARRVGGSAAVDADLLESVVNASIDDANRRFRSTVLSMFHVKQLGQAVALNQEPGALRRRLYQTNQALENSSLVAEELEQPLQLVSIVEVKLDLAAIGARYSHPGTSMPAEVFLQASVPLALTRLILGARHGALQSLSL